LRANRNLLLLVGVVGLFVSVAIFKAPARIVDFRVYYLEGRALIEGHRLLYGPQSGVGWPQTYRYPPLFALLFLPFAFVPLKVSVVIWTAINCTVLYFLICALARRMEFPRKGVWWLIPVCLCGGFIVQEFGGGNAQFLVFTLVATALLSIEQHPRLSAFLLALAVSLKVWPLFFVPYIAARRHFRVAALTMAFVLGLTLLPAAYFGWRGNIGLLRQWVAQEWGTGSLRESMWFPSQSLGGVLQRYLTSIDYSQWPDPNYPRTNFVSMDPRIVRGLWVALAAMGYAGLLLLARTTPRRMSLLTDSLAFCALPLLQPFSHRIELVVLLWPAMLAGALLARREAFSLWPQAFLYAAVAIEAIEPLVPGGQAQRLFQAAGVDFWAACFLTAGLLAGWIESRRRLRESTAVRSDVSGVAALSVSISEK
jgi:hypothetical protein